MRNQSRLFRAASMLTIFSTLAALLAVFGHAPVAEAARLRFGDSSFERVWTRTDAPVAGGAATRSWYWGPKPGMIARESFEGVPGGSRLVQYFDKSRMEINEPGGDASSKWYVTNGLLTVELISGQMQVGLTKYEKRQPSNTPLASDTDDANAPTYASFASVANGPNGDHPAADRKGQAVTATIDKAGRVGQDPSKSRAETNIAYFDATTKHNVPKVFWDFLNMSGTVSVDGRNASQVLSDPWSFATGLPISEAYWARVKVGGQSQDVLIQAFERRVLTYLPSAEKTWQVQMGNIGQHYYEWRYGADPTLLANSLLQMANSGSYHFSSLMELAGARASIPFAKQEGDYQAPNKTKVQQQAIDGYTDLITIGATGYVSNTQTAHTWQTISPAEMGAVDLAALVGVLQYGSNVTKLADENIDGTMSYHLKMKLDPSVIPSVSGLTYASADGELWIDKGTMLFKRLKATLPLASGSAQQGTVVVTINFNSYGKTINIQAPK